MCSGGEHVRDAVAHRARPDHSYSLNSHHEAPLKPESLTLLCRRALAQCPRARVPRPYPDHTAFLVAETSGESQCFFFCDAAQSKMGAAMEVLMTGKLKTAIMGAVFLVGSVGMAAAQDYRSH